jgi:hypothetical protein
MRVSDARSEIDARLRALGVPLGRRRAVAPWLEGAAR